MSETTGKKKKPVSGQKGGHKPKSARPTGSQADKGQGVSLQKKKGLAGRTVEMSSGNQISIDDVMKDNDNKEPAPSGNPPRPRNQAPKEKAPEHDGFAESKEADDESDLSEQIEWSKQVGSIAIWIVSIILIALTFFPGESLWTLIHNFILGILGFKAYLWAALLIFLGYLLTKQKNETMVMDIIRPTAGLIVLSDVLSYILIQSNGYRNVYNEISLGFFQLLGQIFYDGSKIGGTGLLGGSIGEILIAIAGRNGAAIITCILLTALIMLVSHTGPVSLLDDFKRKVKAVFQPGALHRGIKNGFSELFGREQYEKYESFDDDFEEYDDFQEEIDVETEEPEPQPEQEEADSGESHPNDGQDGNLDEIIKKASLKKKKKKLTKAEEIQAESEEFSKQVASEETSQSESDEKEYKFPPVRLLIAPKNSSSADDMQELSETAEMLIRTLDEYGVKASISDISRGPTVTRYEIKPAPGVKINKITNLSNDIALRLAAQSIRIEAPIPGKAAVGIEIPNQSKQMVRIREILGSREFAEAKGALTVALGKDIEGNIILCDLSKMPHLLIAGSTGSGKSVCVNSMLMSILYKYSPENVRMVLIDPKSVEFDMYNGIPHLLVPVVCEPKKAAGALQWAVSEMLKRYGMLKEHGARNIDNYNRLAEQTGEFEKLCRIIIVIDEMADLMIASPKEVEDAIARLAAMARAAGMYMVLATQRPSVDVITGTIKNNIPSRIALAVSSQVDSRTILDEGGAENLIGYGDMLYHPMGSSKHIRVQGCFVDDSEVERVIRFVKQNGQAEYDDSIADEIERNSLDGAGEGATEFEGKDEFFEKAVEVVTEAGQASTSMLQRRLGVGYARAGRIIDQLEEQGIIGPYEGSKPRAVLITRTQWLEMTMSRTSAGKNDPLVRSHSEFAAQTLDNGHEEITARQSEFFNAEQADDYDDETDEQEAAEISSDETDETEEFEDYEEDAESEEYTDSPQTESKQEIDVEIMDEESEPGPDADDETDSDIVTNRSGPVSSVKDFTRFIDKPESAVTEAPPERKPNKINIQKQEKHPYKPASDNRKPKPKAAAPRDFSIFFEDEDDSDDLFEFVPEHVTASDSAPGKNTVPEDIPPWEDEPAVDDSSQSGSLSSPAQETTSPDPSATESVFSDDDDDEEDILSSSWIKRL